MATILLSACVERTIYHHYEATPVAGWEKNDTLNFRTPAVAATADYTGEVALRITGDYPFTTLNLIVEQSALPSGLTRCDTVACQLVDERGYPLGNGVSRYQYLIPFATIHLQQGDHLRIAIRHDMKREILPGVSDVGYRLSRVSATHAVARRVESEKDKQ